MEEDDHEHRPFSNFERICIECGAELVPNLEWCYWMTQKESDDINNRKSDHVEWCRSLK